ncbi:hypothetical protein FQ707_02115 [Bacteroidaceae bacterium HV4-6-C5C]|jgi:hypothetical protein|nr:hypothetical protein FQ707_02115 [Bacteroidaceae bacterium HV4-6-C5C]
MPINFFTPLCQTENIRNKEFGICDDEDINNKTPAYIDKIDPKKWIAIIKNTTGKSLNFTAIDNCVEIRKENGDMDNRCDGMLTNEENIVFIELKDQQKNWVQHAVDKQLQTTIDHFKANYDITKYKHKRAFACNRKHPRFQCSYKEKMSTFYQKNKIRLNLENVIVFK